MKFQWTLWICCCTNKGFRINSSDLTVEICNKMIQNDTQFAALRITGPSYRGVWMCIAGVWDLQTTSFEIRLINLLWKNRSNCFFPSFFLKRELCKQKGPAFRWFQKKKRTYSQVMEGFPKWLYDPKLRILKLILKVFGSLDIMQITKSYGFFLFVGHFYDQPKQMHCFWGKSLKKLLAQHLLLVCCPPKEVPFNDSPQGDWCSKIWPPPTASAPPP